MMSVPSRFLTLLALSSLAVFFLIPSNVHALSYDTADTSTFTFRFDGAYADGLLAYGDGVHYYDLDGNGRLDVLIGERGADNNGRNQSGSLYIIYDSLLDSFKTQATGNIIDMADDSNWNVRIDGEVNTGGNPGFGRSITVADYDNDGDPEIYSVDLGHNADRGALYQIPYSVVSGLTGTGNTVDLATSSNYRVKWTGAGVDDFFGCAPTMLEDINNNGKKDIVVTACQTDYTDGNAGSVYVITDTLLDGFSGTGNTASMGTSTSYVIRYDGPVSDNGARLGWNNLIVADVTQDGLNDIAAAAYFADTTTDAAGSLYIISQSLITSYSGTGNTAALATGTNYTLRIDGESLGTFAPQSFTQLGRENLSVTDYDNDGYYDVVISEIYNPYDSSYATYAKGYSYLINGDTIAGQTGTGNTLIISDSNTYAYKFLGEAVDNAANTLDVNVNWGGLRAMGTFQEDLDNDGIKDIFMHSPETDDNSRIDSGSAYVIFSGLVEDFSTTEFNDFADASNYSFKYQGTDSSETWLGGLTAEYTDVNGDGLRDITLGAYGSDFNSRTNSGSAYIIYYFPHTITSLRTEGSFDNRFDFYGHVSAPDNPTKITRVQWGHHRSFGDLDAQWETDFMNAWNDCTAVDGSFDSNDEEFVCNHAALNNGDGDSRFESPHTIFLRAQDEKGIWTPVSQYVEVTFSLLDNGEIAIRIEDSGVYDEDHDDIAGGIGYGEVTNESEVALAWHRDFANVVEYRVYLREKGASDYEKLATLGSDADYYVVNVDEEGVYEWYVVAVDSSGATVESDVQWFEVDQTIGDDLVVEAVNGVVPYEGSVRVPVSDTLEVQGIAYEDETVVVEVYDPSGSTQYQDIHCPTTEHLGGNRGRFYCSEPALVNTSYLLKVYTMDEAENKSLMQEMNLTVY